MSATYIIKCVKNNCSINAKAALKYLNPDAYAWSDIRPQSGSSLNKAYQFLEIIYKCGCEFEVEEV